MRYKQQHNVPDDGSKISLTTRVVIFLMILLFLIVLYRFGGGGQDWYRGKPYYR